MLVAIATVLLLLLPGSLGTLASSYRGSAGAAALEVSLTGSAGAAARAATHPPPLLLFLLLLRLLHSN